MRFALLLIFVFSISASAQEVDWSDPERLASEAVEAHPALAAAEAALRAARERARGAGAYPNPMVMAGVENQPIDLSNDSMTMYVVGASQEIPRGEKRRVARTVAALEVTRAAARVAAARAELRRDVMLAYWQIAAADSKLHVLDQMKVMLEMLVDAARVRYETGRGPQSDVVRAQLERTRIEHRSISITGEREAAASRLLALVGRGGPVPRIPLPHETAGRMLPSADDLAGRHPALLSARADIEAAEASIIAAKLALKPDVALEATYGVRLDEMDMVSLVARIELPLRRGTTVEPYVREAAARRDAARASVAALERTIRASLWTTAAVHREAVDQLRLHAEVLIPQSRLAFETSLASYQTGGDAYTSISDAYTNLLAVELDYYDFLARHIMAINDFEAVRDGALTNAVGGSMPQPASTSGPSSSATGGMGAMR